MNEFSDRELEVLQLTADGLSTREIGGIMYLSRDAVNRARLKARRKLLAFTIPHAIARAMRKGLIK